MSTFPMPRPIINLDELDVAPRSGDNQPTGDAAERFALSTGAIGSRIGARLLGYNLSVVPPGKRAYPLHSHHANEEMFFVLQGTGELRVGDQRYPIRPGDFMAHPPGGPETAHQIINTGSAELRYLSVSTMATPDLVEYPDSHKLGVLSRQAEKDGSVRVVRLRGRPENNLDYWDGE